MKGISLPRHFEPAALIRRACSWVGQAIVDGGPKAVPKPIIECAGNFSLQANNECYIHKSCFTELEFRQDASHGHCRFSFLIACRIGRMRPMRHAIYNAGITLSVSPQVANNSRLLIRTSTLERDVNRLGCLSMFYPNNIYMSPHELENNHYKVNARGQTNGTEQRTRL